MDGDAARAWTRSKVMRRCGTCVRVCVCLCVFLCLQPAAACVCVCVCVRARCGACVMRVCVWVFFWRRTHDNVFKQEGAGGPAVKGNFSGSQRHQGGTPCSAVGLSRGNGRMSFVPTPPPTGNRSEKVIILHNKNPPTPCLWQAPASTQKTKRKTRPAIRRMHSPERTVDGRSRSEN